MQRSDLVTRILSDGHRADYAPFVSQFIQEAESLLLSKLEAYNLETQLTDSVRVTPGLGLYTLPNHVTRIRTIIPNAIPGIPLDQTDESTVALYSSASTTTVFVQRPTTIVMAGVPGVGATFFMQYFGLPTPLVADTDTNTLLNDYSVLYKELALIFLFKRAQNLDMAQTMLQSSMSLIAEINRKMKKLIGGSRSSNAYNTDFRSSY